MDVSTFKFAVILNKKLDPGIVMNAASHMTASLVAKATPEQKEQMFFVDYRDADDQIHPISGLSLILLKADNSNKIRTARTEAIDKQILSVDFTSTMTQDTYVEQMERTAATKEIDLEYWGLALFGHRQIIESITKKFSLWR